MWITVAGTAPDLKPVFPFHPAIPITFGSAGTKQSVANIINFQLIFIVPFVQVIEGLNRLNFDN